MKSRASSRLLVVLFTILVIVLVLAGCATAEATSTPATAKAPVPTAAPTSTPAAPTATPTAQIQKGGTLRLAVRCDAGSLHVLKGLFCPLPTWLLYDSLLGFDEKGNLYPELAEKWDISPDGKSITFKLRSGAKFHDGTDVNAAAVKFNIETLIKEKGSLAPQVADIVSVEVVDNITTKFNLKVPSAPLLTAMAEQPGFIASPAAVAKYGLDDFSRNPVGAGPFQFVEWVQDDHVTLKRFGSYWDTGKPYVDEVIFKVIPDGSVRTINLKTGNVDWISEVPFKDVAGLKASKDLAVYQILSVGYWRLHLQNSKPPFDSKPLRQAIAYAVNREPIVRGIFLGLTEPNFQPFNPDSWAYNPSFKGLTYDPTKAKAKLAEAGRQSGFEVTLLSHNTEEYAPVIEALQAQFKEVGIRAIPKLGVPAANIATMNDGNFEMAVTQHPGQLDPDIAYSQYHSKGGMNPARYSNQKVDELLDKARQTFDQKERKRYYDEAMSLIADDAGTLVLFHQPLLAASTNKVQNYKLMPGFQHQYDTFKNVWLKR